MKGYVDTCSMQYSSIAIQATCRLHAGYMQAFLSTMLHHCVTLLISDGAIKVTENGEAVQKSEESIELKQNQAYETIHAGYQQQGSEDILVKPNVVYGVAVTSSGGDNSEQMNND